VYDLQGSLVKVLVDQQLTPGVHVASWSGLTDGGRPAAAGVYFVKLEYAGQALRSKMLMIQ